MVHRTVRISHLDVCTCIALPPLPCRGNPIPRRGNSVTDQRCLAKTKFNRDNISRSTASIQHPIPDQLLYAYSTAAAIMVPKGGNQTLCRYCLPTKPNTPYDQLVSVEHYYVLINGMGALLN